MIDSKFYNSVAVSDQPEYFELTLEDLDPDANYLINIVCKIETSKQRYELVYRPITVTWGGSGESSWRWKLYGIIAFFCCGFIAAGVLACWYYCKYKRTDSRLKYEMNDVRNVAGIEVQELPPARSDFQKQPKKVNYTNLDESIV